VGEASLRYFGAMRTLSGLDRLLVEKKLLSRLDGNVAYLCHSASVTRDFEFGAVALKAKLGKRLVKLFSPQHGICTDVQANMIESKDLVHPYLKLPVVSLYADTRVPTEASLRNVDHLIVDLQDIGTRIYTYIWTLSHVMEACRGKDVTVWVLDRPNPIGGKIIEGNVLDPHYASFVGRYPLPMRHGMTMGEVALFLHANYPQTQCQLKIVSMKGWKRSMYFEETGLPWVPPSPNIPTVSSCFPYVGSVIFEGASVSEGRGTTTPFELIGAPGIEPHSFCNDLERVFARAQCAGFKIRPAGFIPTFDKHKGVMCGGFQLLVTNRERFRPWFVFHLVCRAFSQRLKGKFSFNQPPYEYEYEKLPIDILNGTHLLREWVTSSKGSLQELHELERYGRSAYLKSMRDIALYSA
jgi:uncharacterized protein YbbC (DUF1343 family)